MDKVDKHLRCPICLEIPPAEIFQCRNGHQICVDCCGQLQACPCCRVKFENPMIRNRAMESLLDAMEFECPHKGQGCPDKLHRKDLMEHSSKCTFRPFHFCKLLGFKTCDFDAHRHIPALTIQHFQTAHGVSVLQASDFDISLLASALSPPWNPTFTGLSQPTLIKLEKDNYGPTFMVVGAIIGGRTYGWICLHMSDSLEEASKFRFQFSVQNVFGEGGDCELKWQITPSPFKKFEDLLKNPPMFFPLTFFKDHVAAHLPPNVPLKLKVGITKKPQPQSGQKRPKRDYE